MNGFDVLRRGRSGSLALLISFKIPLIAPLSRRINAASLCTWVGKFQNNLFRSATISPLWTIEPTHLTGFLETNFLQAEFNSCIPR